MNTETTTKERIMLFIEKKGIKIGTFERMCGLSNGYLSQLKNRPSFQKIEGICATFPELNKDWLISGNGEMLNETPKADNENSLVEALQNHIRDLQAERDRLLDEIERLRQGFSKTA